MTQTEKAPVAGGKDENMATSHQDQPDTIQPHLDPDNVSRSDLSSDHTDNELEGRVMASRIASHASGPDDIEAHPTMTNTSYCEPGDEIYDRLSKNRKSIIVFVLSFCAFLSPISSTSILAAVPEIAAEYNTTGSIINISNAGYMVLMALSPIFWGPMSQVFGRRPVSH